MPIAVATMATIGTAVLLAYWPTAPLFLYVTLEALHPEKIGWGEKTAWRKCEGAVAGRLAWPRDHEAQCGAMSLCANEASLTSAQNAVLAAKNRQAGCPEF